MSKEKNTSAVDSVAELNKIIDDAAAATDTGDYENALNGFKHALSDAERLFGNNAELNELNEMIDEINILLASDN